jgi:hypothetical protein
MSISPFLENVRLDKVIQELEKSRHTFARHADDLNV